MLWTNKNYPNTMKNLSDTTRSKTFQIANGILRIGKLKEGTTIANAISKLKEAFADYNKKRINNVKIYTL